MSGNFLLNDNGNSGSRMPQVSRQVIRKPSWSSRPLTASDEGSNDNSNVDVNLSMERSRNGFSASSGNTSARTDSMTAENYSYGPSYSELAKDMDAEKKEQRAAYDEVRKQYKELVKEMHEAKKEKVDPKNTEKVEAKEDKLKVLQGRIDEAREYMNNEAKSLARYRYEQATNSEKYYQGMDLNTMARGRVALDNDRYQIDKAVATTVTKCRNKQSHMNELRSVLMEQLKEMKEEAKATKDDKSGNRSCGINCSEDRALEEMIDTYKDLSDNNCGMIIDFHHDRKVNLLEAKRVALESCTFGFLHKDLCEGVSDCNPYPDHVPESLVGCSGLREGQPFFFDRELKAVGRYLAGSQASGDSPAANGHAASLYPTNTLAPGRGKSLWVNVCYECGEDKGFGGICVKWVPANEMEYAKFAMLNKIRKRIRDQKRHILSVNRQIVDLQLKLKGVGARGGILRGDNEMDEVDREDALKKFLKRSMRRAKRRLYRDEEVREQRRLTEDLRAYALTDPEAAHYITGVGKKLKRKGKSKGKKKKSKKGR